MMRYRFRRALKMVGIAAVAVTVFGFVTEGLWNWVVPSVFGQRTINFREAIGLLVLSKILFGGLHRHSGGRHGWGRSMRERWEGMSPEDRARFRTGMRARCGSRFGSGLDAGLTSSAQTGVEEPSVG